MFTSKLSGRFKVGFAAALVAAAITSPHRSSAEEPKAAPPHTPPSPTQKTLYTVGYTHLDTQWRWSYPQVISEFLRKTMEDNFANFEKYPDYTFNFTGSARYTLMKEYFPEDFEKLRGYVKAGRWYPAGSSVDEGDVNMPNGEAIIRQVLYGNQFFRREFGVASDEFMLPDCFGFQASLPSLLAHCGIKGFMTQKLTWGSAVGIPFDLGTWVGPDGKYVVAALNPGNYNGDLHGDKTKDDANGEKHPVAESKEWLDRIDKFGDTTGTYWGYYLYGVGDRGGTVRGKSLTNLEASVDDKNAPIKVVSAKADQIFKDMTPTQIDKLPTYKGDLLLTQHSAGSPTSQSFVKRTNRKLEELGALAERAAVTADWVGDSPYPREKLYKAWFMQLGAHFHDIMAGTALPKSYEYSWNNMVLALNQFAAIATDSVGGVTKAMDTRATGTPVVVFNPLSTDRTDVAVVEWSGEPVRACQVVGPDGQAVPSQVVVENGGTKILFLATVPSVSFGTFDLKVNQVLANPAGPPPVSVTDRTLENSRFKVTLNDVGDIASIIDKDDGNKETLTAPARLQFLHEDPREYPAWNMDYDDRKRPPVGYVSGPCTFKVIENGPVRVTIQTERKTMGSTFVQRVSLSAGGAGGAGDSVQVVNHVDWNTKEVSLEAAFPLVAGNPDATYDSAMAAISRGNNNEKKYEVPQQQWLDLTDSSNQFGTAILNDCKYGSDKPDDHTVRLTLILTPGTRGGYQDQGTQDIGRHEFSYAIAPHAGSWAGAKVPAAAARLNQPLSTWLVPKHDGPLGKSFSLAKLDKDSVSIMAIKKAEESDEVIVRLRELNGQPEGPVTVTMGSTILSAREVDGQEREIGKATVTDGKLVADIGKFAVRAFAVKLAPPRTPIDPTATTVVPLAYDLDAVSTNQSPADGSFGADGRTYPAELFPASISAENIPFTLGPTKDGQANAVVCKGQSVMLPEGYDKVYVLASAIDGDQPVDFRVGDSVVRKTVQAWDTPIGQWDNRVWQSDIPALAYNVTNKMTGLDAGYIKRDEVAWFGTYDRHPQKGREYYHFCYLYKYALDVPQGAMKLTLPDNPKVRVFAVTAAKNGHDQAVPARPLYDTLSDHLPAGPTIEPKGGSFKDYTTLSLGHVNYGRPGDVHYTLDGSEPTIDSPAYTKPVELWSPVTVRAKQFIKGQPVGPEVSEKFDVNDTTPPTVTAASAITIAPVATLVFSEPVAAESATSTASYRFDPPVTVTAATLGDDGRTVALTFDKPLVEGTKLTIEGVTDRAPTPNKVSTAPVLLAVVGPVFSLDEYTADGRTSKEIKDAKVPTDGKTPWTMNFFCKPNGDVADRTLIAGFGTNRDSADGNGRFICKFDDGIHYWSCNRDVLGKTPLTGKWQMLTAVYDGKTLKLYKDAKKIGEESVELADDEPTVRLAPTDAWGLHQRFKGDIRDFTIWPAALPPESVKTLVSGMPK